MSNIVASNLFVMQITLTQYRVDDALQPTHLTFEVLISDLRLTSHQYHRVQTKVQLRCPFSSLHTLNLWVMHTAAPSGIEAESRI